MNYAKVPLKYVKTFTEFTTLHDFMCHSTKS